MLSQLKKVSGFRRLLGVVRHTVGGEAAPILPAARSQQLLTRWIETSAEMVRTRRPEQVRGLFSGFLVEQLGARRVNYLPTEFAQSADTRLLKLPMAGETVEAVLPEGVEWTTEERALATRAAIMTDAVLDGLSRLRDAQRDSMTDALTGLLNRRTLDRLLDREVLLATRHRTPLSVAVIDLDHFKQINDTFGHEAGDNVLRAVAAAIHETLRRTDQAFRFGGDEFAVILPQTSLEQAVAALEKVRVTVAAQGKVTLSSGVAQWSADLSPRALLRAADEAAFQAKRERRDCVRTAA